MLSVSMHPRNLVTSPRRRPGETVRRKLLHCWVLLLAANAQAMAACRERDFKDEEEQS